MTSGRLPGPRLADEFFLAAHDHEASRMRPRLRPVVLGLGLAGALLAELVLDGRIDRPAGSLVVTDPRAAGRGRGPVTVSEVIQARMAAGPDQPVSVWLGQLRHVATDGVLDRLSAAGVLRQVRARRWWGGSTVEYQAVDPNRAMAPEARIFGLVSNRAPDTGLAAATLAGLADATGLRDRLPVWEVPAAEVRTRLSRLRAALPAPLRALLSDVETSVGAALLSTGHH